VVRRPATAAEAKALAHPLRMRILRLCLDQALTNKQLAEWLGKDPGTVLHHVRTLVATGFLVAEEVRQGETGRLEKPYRSTGKSWSLSLERARSPRPPPVRRCWRRSWPSWPRPARTPPPPSAGSP
jgi:DNA-binding transcriptional ArsR family regulator